MAVVNFKYSELVEPSTDVDAELIERIRDTYADETGRFIPLEKVFIGSDAERVDPQMYDDHYWRMEGVAKIHDRQKVS